MNRRAPEKDSDPHGHNGIEGIKVAMRSGDADDQGTSWRGGGSRVSQVLLLRIIGGMHAGLHCSCAREVPRSLDLWAVRRGGEGRIIEIRNGHHHR